MTTPGRCFGPRAVIQTWPESVEPLRAVNRIGFTMP